jgi:hypothetical protein
VRVEGVDAVDALGGAHGAAACMSCMGDGCMAAWLLGCLAACTTKKASDAL